MSNGKGKQFGGSLVAFIALALVIVQPALAGLQAAPKPATLEGIVYESDMSTPVEGAVVKIREVQSKKEYQGQATDKKGAYKIAGILGGRYVVGVSAKSGDYNFEFEVFLQAGEEARLDIGLKKDTPPAVLADHKNPPFFLTPVGLAVLVAATAGLVTGFVVAGDEKSAAKR